MRRPAAIAIRAVSSVACAAMLLLIAPPAHAQWSASAGLDSQALFRGLAMSDGQASPHAALSWDGASGSYAGLSLARVAVASGAASALWRGQLGYARRWPDSSLAWEAGVDASRFEAQRELDYAEAYAGLSGDGWTLRVHGAPDYLGQRTRTVYTELDAGGPAPALLWTLSATSHAALRWSAHLGALHGAEDGAAPQRRWQADWRLGLALDEGPLTLQLARVGAQRTGAVAHGADPVAAPYVGTDAAYGGYGASAWRPLTGGWQASIDLYF